MKNPRLSPALLGPDGWHSTYSCLSNLHVFEEWVTALIPEKKNVDVAYVDFAKALGSLKHCLLGFKLQGCGVYPQLVS